MNRITTASQSRTYLLSCSSPAAADVAHTQKELLLSIDFVLESDSKPKAAVVRPSLRGNSSICIPPTAVPSG